MVWLELFGFDAQGQPYGAQRIADPFSSDAEAIAEARRLAVRGSFSFGRVAGYRVLDGDNVLLRTGFL